MLRCLLVVAALTPLPLAAAPPAVADLLFINGKVWTGDPARPEASAVAVARDRIVAVGSDADLRPLSGAATRVIDVAGKRVVPGFADSHLHLLNGGLQLSRVELKDAADEAEFGKRLRDFDAKLPPGRWMLGGNWDHDRTFAGRLPTAALLDTFVPTRPVFLRRYDGHMAVANTAALKLGNVTADTKDPPGGVVVRGPDGKTPAGVLKDNAMGLVPDPEADEGEIADAIRAALAAFAEAGITAVQDMEGSGAAARRTLLKTLQRLDRRGELTCRVDVHWPIEAQRELTTFGVEAGFGTAFVRVGGVKGFMDGSLGSSTAKFFDPFTIDPTTSGVFVTEPDRMRNLVRSADAAGLSVAVHAIGDRANADLLDVYAAMGPKDRRPFRVEHVQHLRPTDYSRFKQLGVIASMQPYHVIDDGRWAEGRIGATRCGSSYAFRSLLDAGATLAFGSDWPVAPLDVLAGIDAAVNRRTLDGKHPNGWFPEQRITVAEAVAAYTAGGAAAAGQGGDRGVLGAGKWADLVVLDRDIFSPAERDRIADTKVTMTVVGGTVVYERK
jgi:predicted amidohydrolase YtcJ